jgi:integrase
MHKYTAKLILRTSKKNAEGHSPIALQLFINGERARISTGEYLHPDCWDAESGTVLTRTKHGITKERATEINMILFRSLEKANAIFRQHKIMDEPLNKETMLSELNNTMSRNSFHDWAAKRIEELKGVRAPKTLTGYRVTFAALREFQPVLKFSDLSGELVERFERYLRTERNLGVNARAKYHSHLKSFTRALARTYKGIPNIYDHFQIKQVSGKRVYLVKAEVQALTRMYNAQVLGDRLQEMLSMFLFSCHTGLRYSDLVNVEHANIIDGYLSFLPVKTQGIEKRVDVPLSPIAIELLHNQKGKLFNYTCNEYYRRQLKVIGSLCGLKKQLSSHVGRHTFATSYIMNGGTVPTLQKLMGHSKIETTMIYVHLSKLRLEEERTVIDNLYKSPYQNGDQAA